MFSSIILYMHGGQVTLLLPLPLTPSPHLQPPPPPPPTPRNQALTFCSFRLFLPPVTGQRLVCVQFYFNMYGGQGMGSLRLLQKIGDLEWVQWFNEGNTGHNWIYQQTTILLDKDIETEVRETLQDDNNKTRQ